MLGTLATDLKTTRRLGYAVLLAAGLLVACASKAPPFERGLTVTQRASLGTIRMLTVVVQDELGAEYHSRTTTAKILNTAQISGVTFNIKGLLYIGPALDSITPWIDSRDYVPGDIEDVPGVVSTLDPSNAVRTATKLLMAPLLRASERSDHAEAGPVAYARIAPARAALKKFKVVTMLRDDQTAQLKSIARVNFTARDVSREWPLTLLQKGVEKGARPLLLLFTQYTLSADLRELHVNTEATLMRHGDTAEQPGYRNRFTYESPRLPLPAQAVSAGDDATRWKPEELAPILLKHWTRNNGELLKAELKRASEVSARYLALDLSGHL